MGTPALAQSDAPVATETGISPLFGRIHAFYGDIGAEFGRIHAFSGDLTPFFGRIHAFFGDPSTFWGNVTPYNPTIDPNTGNTASFDPFWGSNSPYSGKNGAFYGTINNFWNTQFAQWQNVMAAWSVAQTPADAQALANSIQTGLVAQSGTFWNKTLSSISGKPTAASIINPQLAAAGVAFLPNGNIDPASLLAMSATQQASLFLGVYDSLMDYAGTGHVDWWMGAIHTSPALAQINGSVPSGGSPPTIGMLDFVVTPTGQQVSKQVTQFGNTVFTDGHGAAVGSLIIGATDGSGVMGILPTGAAKVAVYNPYDATGTTNWTDVGTGVATLTAAVFKDKVTPVGVLNASLGVPGWTLNPGWNDALANANAYGHNLVIAAGNDGSQQTANVPWNFANNPNLLIVGSVGANGTISQFSNTPGEACLLPTSSSSTICSESNKLKYRFIVAPGELILVSDGMGGHYRQSGTSLAAPLVSGTIALLQNRWPWLSNYPDETASIILKSATPLGTQPGADPVYGVGELNVAASQAPLDWSKVVFISGANSKGATGNGAAQTAAKAALGVAPTAPLPPGTSASTLSWATIAATGVPLSTVSAQLGATTQSTWDAGGLYYTAFEPVGNTFRDFQIPLASKLVGQTATTLAGGQLYQSYLSAALHAQAGHYAGLNVPAPDSLLTNGFTRSSMPAGMIGTMQLRVNVASAPPPIGFRNINGGNRFDTGATLIGDKSAVSFGFGNGASALDPGASFGLATDHDLATGGANPVLGLASGGSYVGARSAIAPGLTVGMGVTQRNVWRNPLAFGLNTQQTGAWIDRYAASAQTINADYLLGRGLTAHVGFTRLNEGSALLGVQSVDRNDLAGGSTTTAATLGLDVRLSHGFVLSGSATMARTHAAGGQITTNQLTSAAAELALTKSGVFGHHDQLRLTAANPLHTVGGQLQYSSIGVVDRQTGALGLVTQSIAANRGTMPLVTEVSYGRSLAGRGEVSLFGRYQKGGQLTQGDYLGTMGGVQLHLAF